MYCCWFGLNFWAPSLECVAEVWSAKFKSYSRIMHVEFDFFVKTLFFFSLHSQFKFVHFGAEMPCMLCLRLIWTAWLLKIHAFNLKIVSAYWKLHLLLLLHNVGVLFLLFLFCLFFVYFLSFVQLCDFLYWF